MSDEIKKEDKADLIRAARLAESNPVAVEFWAEVAEHLDQSEAKAKPVVEKR